MEFSDVGGCVGVDVGGDLAGALLRHLSSAAEPTVANPQTRIQIDCNYLARQPAVHVADRNIKSFDSNKSR